MDVAEARTNQGDADSKTEVLAGLPATDIGEEQKAAVDWLNGNLLTFIYGFSLHIMIN